jgi:glycosyltransferase involved in cell wall biosynthesis
MDRPRLLLLTTRYPYGFGEAFLAEEIAHLARHFSVTIVPWMPVSDVDARCPLPDGVSVRPDIASTVFADEGRIWQWLLRRPPAATRLLGLTLPDQKRLSATVWQRMAAAVRFADVLGEAFRGMSVDIIYSYWMLSSALTGVLARDQGIAKIAVSRAHGGDLYHERRAEGFQPGQKQMIAGLDRIFCISEHGASYLRRLYPGYRQKIEISRLGVPPAPGRNKPGDDGRLHLVTCAYLTPVKRIHLLVEALTHCDFPVMWTHLGGGQLEADIRAQAKQLPDNIQWRITGPLPHADVLRFYQEHPADLFVNVSASEGVPVSMMEAMSYGIPVAATDVGGVSELVHHGDNGFLWPADVTPANIAQTLAGVYHQSAGQKQRLRDAAWQTWHDTVNADVQYPEFTRRLLSLVQS